MRSASTTQSEWPAMLAGDDEQHSGGESECVVFTLKNLTKMVGWAKRNTVLLNAAKSKHLHLRRRIAPQDSCGLLAQAIILDRCCGIENPSHVPSFGTV